MPDEIRCVYLVNWCSGEQLEAHADMTRKHQMDDLAIPNVAYAFLEKPDEKTLAKLRQEALEDACGGWDEDDLASMKWTDVIHGHPYAHFANHYKHEMRRMAEFESWTWNLYEDGSGVTECVLVLTKRPVGM